MDDVACLPSARAVMIALPALRPLTTPVEETTAFVVSELVQAGNRDRRLFCASRAKAVNVSAWPTAMVARSGAMVRLATGANGPAYSSTSVTCRCWPGVSVTIVMPLHSTVCTPAPTFNSSIARTTSRAAVPVSRTSIANCHSLALGSTSLSTPPTIWLLITSRAVMTMRFTGAARDAPESANCGRTDNWTLRPSPGATGVTALSEQDETTASAAMPRHAIARQATHSGKSRPCAVAFSRER